MTAPAKRIDGAPAAPPSPSQAWRVPADALPRERIAAAAVLPPDLATRADALALGEVVDIALRNNPQTLLSWSQARAGAAQYGAAAAQYLPTLDASLNVLGSSTTVGQTLGGVGTRRALTPQVSLSYLLLDFGGRSGSVAAAKDAAIALDLTHNATLQNVALQVEGAYFTFQAQRGLATALRLNVATADSNLVSAQQRYKAGVATITDDRDLDGTPYRQIGPASNTLRDRLAIAGDGVGQPEDHHDPQKALEATRHRHVRRRRCHRRSRLPVGRASQQADHQDDPEGRRLEDPEVARSHALAFLFGSDPLDDQGVERDGAFPDRVRLADHGQGDLDPRLVVDEHGAERLADLDAVADLLVQDHADGWVDLRVDPGPARPKEHRRLADRPG